MAHALRLAHRRTCLIAAVLATLATSTAASAAEKIAISVNKTTQRMSVVVDGKPHWTWPVSTGKAKFDTPPGAFTPFRMEADHYSKEWDEAPMPHAIFFTKDGHAIHGTMEEKRLGRRASHGCVRVSRSNAAKLFALVRKHGLANTRVAVFVDKPAAPPTVAPPAVAPPAVSPQWPETPVASIEQTTAIMQAPVSQAQLP